MDMTNYLHRFTHETNLEDHKIPWILWTFKATWVNAPTDNTKKLKIAPMIIIYYMGGRICAIFSVTFLCRQEK